MNIYLFMQKITCKFMVPFHFLYIAFFKIIDKQ